MAKAIGAAFARAVVLPEAPTPAGDAPARASVVVGHDMQDSVLKSSKRSRPGSRRRGSFNVVRIELCSTDGAVPCRQGLWASPAPCSPRATTPRSTTRIKLCRAGARPVGQDSGLAEVRRLAEGYLDDGLPAAADEPDDGHRPRHARGLRGVPALARRPVRDPAAQGRGRRRERDGWLHRAGRPGHRRGPARAAARRRAAVLRVSHGTYPNHEANPLDPKNLLGPAGRRRRARRRPRARVRRRRRPLLRRRRARRPGVAVRGHGARRAARGREGGRGGAHTDRDPQPHHVARRSPTSSGPRAPGRCARAWATRSSRRRWPRTTPCSAASTARTTTSATSSSPTRERFAAMHVLAALGSQPPLSALGEMYEPYVASGEINSTVADEPAARARVVEAYVTQQGGGPVDVDELRRADRLALGLPPRSGGSTSAPRTPSRCCG